MLARLIEISLEHRFVICAIAVVCALFGLSSLSKLPIDAFPDTTPVQVQVNTVAPALTPEEIEQQVTNPLEWKVSGIPKLVNVRSVSKFGFSQIVATFSDEADLYLSRQLVLERIQAADLPEGVGAPQLGPIATGLGEVFHYALRAKEGSRSLTELRELHDWVIKPALLQVSGVAEANSWGGYEKQYHVLLDTISMVKFGLTVEDVFSALESNNRNVGGGQIERSGETLLVHGIGLASSIEEIEEIVIAEQEGIPVYVSDVAEVAIGHEIRRGAVSASGKGEIVLGLGFMLMGENSAEVTRALSEKLSQIKASLPEDVILEVLYDRTDLIEKVISTVEHNLLLGALLVIAVLFAFLGNMRAGIIVASAIPLSLVFAGSMMLEVGIAASLLSFGALDFGLIVDSSVIMAENCVRHASMHADKKWNELIRDAALEVRRPTLFGELIILIVFLPILTLEGIEGKFFRPMALTMIFALLGSLVFSLTLLPVLCSLFLKRGEEEKEPRVIEAIRGTYLPLLKKVFSFPKQVLIGAVAVVFVGALFATQLGTAFLPRLNEGALAVNMVRLAGISVDESVRLNTNIEKALLKHFPDEIERVWSRIGSAEIATDPMGIELTDFFITLKDRGNWKVASTQEELTEKFDEEVFRKVPGAAVSFTQPIEMRLNEMVAGIRSDVGIKIYGDDFDKLTEISDQVQRTLLEIDGAADIVGEQLSGQPILEVRLDNAALSRMGIPKERILNIIQTIGGKTVGEIRYGQRRFPLVVRLGEGARLDIPTLKETVLSSGGKFLSLSDVATLEEREGPSTINHEWGRRRVTVQVNVRDRDIGSFVSEAQQKITEEVNLPEGYLIEWGGQFENMIRAQNRLMLVVPLALGLVLLLLYLSLHSVTEVLIVSTGIPLGAVGGVLALWLRGMPLTVSAAIGFVALAGVAMLNGLVLVTFIQQLRKNGLDVASAIREACSVRLRPILMTALVAMIGFLPMAVNTGVGGEVQRPLATVVIGGLLTNTLLSLFVLPALYLVTYRRK